jgi:phosphate/sulfate permease
VILGSTAVRDQYHRPSSRSPRRNPIARAGRVVGLRQASDGSTSRKDKGKTRPIGVSAFEDRLVQDALREVLEAIYEQDFRDCSHGFRHSRHLYEASVGTKPPPFWIRGLLLLSCTGVSFAHGSNDRQKGWGSSCSSSSARVPTAVLGGGRHHGGQSHGPGPPYAIS